MSPVANPTNNRINRAMERMILTVSDLTVLVDVPLSCTRKNIPEVSAAIMTKSRTMMRVLNSNAPDIDSPPKSGK